MPTPSGEQIEISSGDARAVVVEVGAGLRRYEVGDRDIVDGYAEDEMCEAGRGQILVPWPNRIREGRYAWDGRELRLATTEPETGHAIHGLTRWTAWRVVERGPDRVVMGMRLHPRPGYPFSLGLTVEYRVGPEGLTVRTSATNRGPTACPYGSGAHPYLRVGTPTVDAAWLRAPGRRRLVPDDSGIPTGAEEAVEGTRFDFTAGRTIGDAVLDTAYTDLVRDGDGRAWAELRAAGGAEASLWLDERHTHLMLFTGDPQPSVARRSLGVEPMTCAPNAFASGDGLRSLAPGESFSATWGIRP